jgi:hypothetical protein
VISLSLLVCSASGFGNRAMFVWLSTYTLVAGFIYWMRRFRPPKHIGTGRTLCNILIIHYICRWQACISTYRCMLVFAGLLQGESSAQIRIMLS